MRLAVLLCFALAATADERRLLEEANAHYRALRSEEAVRLYREYLARYKDRADVRVFLGAALLNIGRLDEAASEARRAIALNSAYAKAYTLGGRIYAERRQWASALDLLGKAVAMDPRDSDAWYFLGRAQFDAGQFELAAGAFRHSDECGPPQSRVHEGLGLVYEALGRAAECEQSYGRAIQLDPGGYRAYLLYGVFLFKQSRLSESLTILGRAFALQPDSVDVRFEFSRVLYHAENNQQALVVLTPARTSRQCRVHNLLAKIHARLEDQEGVRTETLAMQDCVEK